MTSSGHSHIKTLSQTHKLLITTSIALINTSFLVYLDVKGFELDPITILLTILFGTYYSLGILVGWFLLSEKVKVHIPMVFKPIYYFIKFYVSALVGFFYLPFWIFSLLSKNRD